MTKKYAIFMIRATCGADGKWSVPIPSCLAPCLVPEIEHGFVSGSKIGSKLEHGSSVSVNCTDNYEASSYDQIRYFFNRTLQAIYNK